MKHSSCRSLWLAALTLTLGACGGGGGSSADDSSSGSPPAAANKTPTISGLSRSESIAQDSSGEAMAFSVTDGESAADAVNITVTSSNPEVIPADAIQLSGNGSSRALLLIPADGVAGTSTVTVTATDPGGMSTQQSIDVTVTSSERSFTEMVGTAYAKPAEAEAEETVGFSWVDNPEHDETAFDHLFQQ